MYFVGRPFARIQSGGRVKGSGFQKIGGDHAAVDGTLAPKPVLVLATGSVSGD
jgi:hypothetical protein